MAHLNYAIDENDIRSQQALDEVSRNAPKPQVVQDMQQTLARVLQSQTPPAANGSDPAATAKSVGNQWGSAN